MQKLIEELTALDTLIPGRLTISTPDSLEDVSICDADGKEVIVADGAYAALIVAMRNALPELLHYAKIGCEPCDDCEEAATRAEEAEGFSNELVSVLIKHFPEAEADHDYPGEDVYYAPEFDRVIHNAINMQKLLQHELNSSIDRAEKAEAELEQVKAERDVLAEYLGRRDKKSCPPHPSNQCYLNITSRFCSPYNNNAQGALCWLKYAAQEAAKRGEE